MNVKKYRAANSQQAMRMIRAAHGPDAIVLDCLSIAGGVEFVVSWDEHGVATDSELTKNTDAVTPPHRESENIGAEPKVVWSQSDELLAMKQEFAEMKSMLHGQLKEHTRQDAAYQAPQQQPLQAFLADIDIEPQVAKQITAAIPGGESDAIQREMAKVLITKQLVSEAPINSGAICLVGPQGSGKTTSIAKIAAQYVKIHGRENIALITTDTARVGAQEQLRAYGRILQIPVHSAATNDEAIKTFRILSSKALVLIDTAGVSFRDTAGMAQLNSLLSNLQGVSTYLTLPADVEAYVQNEIIESYSALSLQGVLLSRIDEAIRLGGAVSNLIKHGLPLTWISNGPRVPRNLSVANSEKLVNMAVRMAKVFGRGRSEIKLPSPQDEKLGSAINVLG